MSRSSIALVNLRAVVILIVLAFHSVLPYLASLPPAAYPFDERALSMAGFSDRGQPAMVRLRPVLRLAGCGSDDPDVFPLGPVRAVKPCAQGKLEVLVGPSAADWPAVRAGRHFSCAARLLSRLSQRLPSTPASNAYWQHWLALPFWPCGPQWFLGQLLAFNVLAAAMHRFVPGWDQRLVRLVAFVGGNPVRFFVVLVTISALAYVPLVLAYSPFAWVNIGPISFQLSRPLHYLVYFLAGCGGRDLWPRSRPACLRWRSGAALAGVARRSLCRLPALGRADLGDDGGLEQRSPDRETCGRHGLCCRLRGGLPVLAGDLPALCTLAPAGVRQPVGQCLPHVSDPLRVCRLAAICAAGHRPVCDRQGRDRVRRHPDHELGHRRRHGRRAAGLATECDHTRSTPRVKTELTLDGK